MNSSRINFSFFVRSARFPSTIVALLVMVLFCTTPSFAEEKKSADEVAKELANPNASLAKLELKNHYTC